jgi:hypothetical protein
MGSAEIKIVPSTSYGEKCDQTLQGIRCELELLRGAHDIEPDKPLQRTDMCVDGEEPGGLDLDSANEDTWTIVHRPDSREGRTQYRYDGAARTLDVSTFDLNDRLTASYRVEADAEGWMQLEAFRSLLFGANDAAAS